jgi:hypothetical protein
VVSFSVFLVHLKKKKEEKKPTKQNQNPKIRRKKKSNQRHLRRIIILRGTPDPRRVSTIGNNRVITNTKGVIHCPTTFSPSSHPVLLLSGRPIERVGFHNATPVPE